MLPRTHGITTALIVAAIVVAEIFLIVRMVQLSQTEGCTPLWRRLFANRNPR